MLKKIVEARTQLDRMKSHALLAVDGGVKVGCLGNHRRWGDGPGSRVRNIFST